MFITKYSTVQAKMLTQNQYCVNLNKVNQSENEMKQGIHPNYNKEVTVKCACGAQFLVGSTTDSINIEICSNCHPFYTGKQKLVDTAGRVDKFKARMEAAAKAQSNKTEKKNNNGSNKKDK